MKLGIRDLLASAPSRDTSGAEAPQAPSPRAAPHPGDFGRTLGERGIGLFEVMAGSLIATLAVLGLAYSFGIGRGLIDRYAMARAAMGEAQRAIDGLAIQPPSTLTPGTYSQPFVLGGTTVGTTQWIITWVDDPADGLGGADLNPNDLKRLNVQVSWKLGDVTDVLALSRVVLGH